MGLEKFKFRSDISFIKYFMTSLFVNNKNLVLEL